MSNRTVLIAGATGLVGQELLKGLLTDESVAQVHCLGRRAPGLSHPKLHAHVVDFKDLPRLPTADELYLALGTTIKVAGSQEAFRAVDYEANLAVTTAAMATGCRRIGLVSAMGADPKSKVFYNRIKGELEGALSRTPFESLVIARPSLLVGDRAALGQPVRRGEQWGFKIGKWLSFLIPSNYQPIASADVAKALLRDVPNTRGKVVLLSAQMNWSTT